MPPCLTPDGVAYERVVGQTVPVKDPDRLADLFERGQAASEVARRAADQAVTDTFQQRQDVAAGLPRVLVALAAVGGSDAHERTLFTPVYQARLEAELSVWWDHMGNRCRVRVGWHQDSVEAHLECQFREQQNLLARSRINGVVSLAYFDAETSDALRLVCDEAFLRRLWGTAAGLLTAYASDAREAHLNIVAFGPRSRRPEAGHRGADLRMR